MAALFSTLTLLKHFPIIAIFSDVVITMGIMMIFISSVLCLLTRQFRMKSVIL